MSIDRFTRLYAPFFVIHAHSVRFWALKKGLLAPFLSFCGELGIRTPGPVTVNSFQDCRIRPLCQLSAANVGRETQLCKKYLL